MNVNPSAVTESTKLSKGVSTSTSASEEVPETEGFFAKLAAMLKGGDKSEAKDAKVSDVEGASTEKLLKADADVEASTVESNSESSEESQAAKQSQSSSVDAAVEGEQQEVKLSPELAKFVEQDDAKGTESEQVQQTVAESEALLGRLEQSNKALQAKDGNSLPPQTVSDEQAESDAMTESAAGMAQAGAVATSQAPAVEESQQVAEAQNVASAANMPQSVQGQTPVAVESETPASAHIEQSVTAETHLTQSDAAQLSAGKTTQSMPVDSEQDLAAATVAAGALASPELGATPTGTPIVTGDGAVEQTSTQVDGVAMMHSGQSSAENAELTEDASQAEAIAWATPANATNESSAKLAPEGDGLHKSAAKAAVHPAHLSAAAASAAQVNSAATNVNTPAAQSALSPATPMDLSAAQQLQATAAPTVKAEQAALQAALGAKAAATLGKMTHKQESSSASDASFAQQLSHAAGQTTPANQLRAEQAAQAQPALQLSREMAGDQVAERVQMMMSKNLKNIDIRLDPPELGRMQIRMNMNGDNATVHFTVANQQARDMVEHAMPRLREMLAQQGMQLADSSVQQQASGQQQGRYATQNGGGSGQGTSGQHLSGEENLEPDVKLDLNVASKRDGISYYA
ncbi:flagellar hook-length control protein FliK [Vibrio panuliri]|uniref:Flagellar hook-length control protein-like C-terminal domain-containing protein n=1 Tax=Vibrio panuliri TaxID=1381081 RepID=A0ABX3FKJ5_9VIBR|nr:flagellar hook-length control protein FliK [Vibrio panuliri]KAB1455008.1 flagellar hook-length control protein FliK [Vibrio panuliri]OLQ94731.1 hypothetical protein BIY20_00120 [Vibrio panuliri]